MAVEGALDGLFVATDVLVVYSDESATPPDMAGWTVVLDIRRSDTAGAALLSTTGVVSGTYDADPDVNTQVITFTLTDEDLSADTFPGDDITRRYSIKRTDAGAEQVLRYGDVPLTRVTQV